MDAVPSPLCSLSSTDTVEAVTHTIAHSQTPLLPLSPDDSLIATPASSNVTLNQTLQRLGGFVILLVFLYAVVFANF